MCSFLVASTTRNQLQEIDPLRKSEGKQHNYSYRNSWFSNFYVRILKCYPRLSVAEKSLFGTFPLSKPSKQFMLLGVLHSFFPGTWGTIWGDDKRGCFVLGGSRKPLVDRMCFLLLFTFQWSKKDGRETHERRSKLPDYLAFNLTVSFKRGDAQHHWTLMQITWWEMALSCVAKLKWMLSQSWSQGGCMTSHWCCSDAPLKVLDGMYDAHESSVVKVLWRGKGCSPSQSDAWPLEMWCSRIHCCSRLSWRKDSHSDRRLHWGKQS